MNYGLCLIVGKLKLISCDLQYFGELAT
uniref:Uncharacterized protein n=1 Tax=Arundo donax TaxID=35708 RepID=A0A0A9D7Q2_ARUDO